MPEPPPSPSEAPATSHNVVPLPPIAIVGIGMRAPGGIDSVSSLWDTIIHKKSHHACLASDPRFLRRFNPEDFEAMFSVTPDARMTLHGNLLDDTPGLDEMYFGISKRDSEGMDVQIKLLLHVAHEALEDAGFTGAADGSAFDPGTFGVFVGAATDDFFKDPNTYPIDIYHLVRNQRAFLSGQISHHFGLRGPSVSVDTVCAGSMTAINDACRALTTGECRAAIAGGVHVMTPISAPPTVMALKLAGFLDPKGQCKPFLADGGGYCRAEGAGLVVMKRLSDAIRDGDRIHGVIQGMGTGNMSSPRSIVRPDGSLQGRSLARAVSSSGIHPSDISFVEAHGPGTQQGDPAELFSICAVLAQQGTRDRENLLTIGSVKGNLGHSEAASGALSLFKVLAMMRYQTIPPQATFHPSRLNPRLRSFFEEFPIRISDQPQKWNSTRRIAVVNNFGATGYAGSIVVEDPSSCVPAVGPSKTSVPIFPFMISAMDRQTLVALANRYADWLDIEGASITLSDLSYATTVRRKLHSSFCLILATSHTDLVRQLRNETARPIIDASSFEQPRTLAFCFSGQGGPRHDPRQSSLYSISKAFSSMVDICFSISEEEKLVAPEDIEALELFALQAGLAEMWTSWGLKPVALAGHSFGEYNALIRAGVLSVRDALKLVGIRAALIREKCVGIVSKMAALQLPIADTRALLSQQRMTNVELACINSDTQVTLAGTPEDLESFHEEVLKSYPSARWKIVNMKTAFHSRFVEPMREDFLSACKDVEFLSSTVTVLSGPLGRICLPGDDELTQHDYLVRHCREANRFGQAVRDYARQNELAGFSSPDWIELGAHSTTIGFIPLSSGGLKLPSQQNGVDGWMTVLNTLVQLRAVGHKVDFSAFHRDINPAARHIDLPKYPFKLQPHPYPIRKASRGLVENGACPRVTSTELSPILESHRVANTPICPAAVYMSLILTASYEKKKSLAFRASRLVMTMPFTGLKDDWLQARKSTPSTFDVINRAGKVHASMQVEMCDETRLLESLSLFGPLVSSMRSIQTLSGTSILNTRLAYDLFSQTVSYGPHCQGLRRVWVAEDGHQAWAISSNEPQEAAHRLQLEPPSLQRFSPILIDRACQLIGLLVNTSPDRAQGKIFVASKIDQVEMALSNIRNSASFETYASFELVGDSGTDGVTALGQVFTFDEDQQLVATFRGVRMRQMKQHKMEHLIHQAAVESSPSKLPANCGPATTLPTPLSTPKGEVEDSLNDESRKSISALCQTTLGVDYIPADKKLVELGLDSLSAVEIGVELGRLFPNRKVTGEFLIQPDITLSRLFDALCPSSSSPLLTPRISDDTSASHLNYPLGVRKHVSASEAITPASSISDGALAVLDHIGTNPELLQHKPNTLPVMLIHDGGGTALAYRLLGDLGHTLLGVHSPGLHQGKGIVSIRHAADIYAAIARQWLHKHSPHQPQLLVGGWSLGGTIAIALAAAHPDLVVGVILLDPPPPGTAAMTLAEAEQIFSNPNARSSAGFGTLVRNQLKLNAQLLSVDADREGGQRNPVVNLRAPVYLVSAIEPLHHQDMEAADFTSPGSCLAWMVSRERASMAEGAWSDILGSLLVGTHRVPGNHFTIFTHEYAGGTTRAIRQACDVLEANLA